MKILHPTDFSKTADKAQTLALDLAQTLGAALDIVHVQKPSGSGEGDLPFVHLSPGNLSAEVKRRLDELQRLNTQHLREQLETLTPKDGKSILLFGNPRTELVDLLPNYDLVVMGAHGSNVFDNFLFGGVAGRLLRRSPVPVLTVRQETEVKHLGRILVATDFGEASKHAWHWCGGLAKHGIKLVAAHVIDIERLKNDVSYTRVVSDALSQFARGQAERQVIREGNPLHLLPHIAEEVGADAIAIGLRHHDTALGALLGSRADGLLRSSRVPILSVPLLGD